MGWLLLVVLLLVLVLCLLNLRYAARNYRNSRRIERLINQVQNDLIRIENALGIGE